MNELDKLQKSGSDVLGGQSGFSLIELLVVLVVAVVFLSVTLFFYQGHRKLYRPDDTTLLISDALQEARQRSLTQRETIRIEIDKTSKRLRVIDENQPNTADDDRVIRELSLPEPALVTVGERPINITVNPPESMPVPTATFLPSTYPMSVGHSVCTIRFMRDGTVTDAGTNSVGSGAVTTGVTIHIWAPLPGDPQRADIARSITIIGASGVIRAWEWDPKITDTNKWKDSRRAGSLAS
jgi:prepilin-type N-terminal cleavage/methylation domain-containing protein